MGGGNNTNPHAQGMKWLKRRKKKMKRINEERMQWKEDEEDEEGEEREKKKKKKKKEYEFSARSIPPRRVSDINHEKKKTT
mmetsp:Transcript_3702/g.12412  ORF Transcript_3702/g.12412 Transcript_3702/m.12412 type:complete len:81 (+) Transcript_3702:77-319(+)